MCAMGRSIMPVLIALCVLVGTLAVLGCSGSDGGSFILPGVEDVRDVAGTGGGEPAISGLVVRPTPVGDSLADSSPSLGWDGGDLDGRRFGADLLTPWPTFTPVPVVESDPEPLSGGEGEGDSTKVASVVLMPGPRFTCLIDYRKWLTETPWENARDLHVGMAEFRELRPDCNAVIFVPEYSAQPLCRDRDRVGGYRVGSFFSRGESYNYNLELLSTRRGGSGDMLIHFVRLPELTSPGCWYYSAAQEVWYETVAGAGGQAVATTPVVVARPVVGFGFCDEALRRRFANDPGIADAFVFQGVVDQVTTGLTECALGWSPRPFEVRLVAHCPLEETGRKVDGSVVVHWSSQPGDGASCWIYDPSSSEWESR